MNSLPIIRELKKQKRKYTIVKDFANAFLKAKIGKSYFFQNGKKLIPFYKKSDNSYLLSFSNEHTIDEMNGKNNVEISDQTYDVIETYETINIVFKNQRKNKYLKLNGNEYTNSFILNFGQSIPFDLWKSENFCNNIIKKLPQNKTYLLETNNAGTMGIPIGIVNEFKNQNRIMMVKFQLNDISTPLSIEKLKEKLRKGKLEKYIKNNIDFESKKSFTISNGEKLSTDLEEGNTISESLLKESKNKFFDSSWHGKYIQFQLRIGTFPGYILNSNLVRIGNFLVSNIDILHYLNNKHVNIEEKCVYNGIPGKLKMVNPFINALVDEVELLDIPDIPQNNNNINNNNNKNNDKEEKSYSEKDNNKNTNKKERKKNKNKNKKDNNTNTNKEKTKNTNHNKMGQSLSVTEQRIVQSAKARMLNDNYDPFAAFSKIQQPQHLSNNHPNDEKQEPDEKSNNSKDDEENKRKENDQKEKIENEKRDKKIISHKTTIKIKKMM